MNSKQRRLRSLGETSDQRKRKRKRTNQSVHRNVNVMALREGLGTKQKGTKWKGNEMGFNMEKYEAEVVPRKRLTTYGDFSGALGFAKEVAMLSCIQFQDFG